MDRTEMLLLFTISLSVISHVTGQTKESVFRTSQIIARQNNPNINSVPNEFMVFFNLDCLRNMESVNRNIIGEFLSEFPCYSINTEKIDKFPEISEYMIVVNKQETCDTDIDDDDKEIIWSDFCLQEVEQNEIYELSTTDTECLSRDLYPDADTLWNLDAACPSAKDAVEYIQYDASFDPGFDIMVVDSGIDTTHPEFQDVNISTLYDAFDGDEITSSHGQFAASVIIGSNVGVVRANNTQLKVYDVRVGTGTGMTGYNRYGGFNAIFQHLIKSRRKAIINFSYGGPGNGTGSFIAQIRNIKSLGGIFLVAAGNAGSDASNYYPAQSEDVITVGSHTDYIRQFRIKGYWVGTFSNYGDAVDIYAPGTDIYGAFINDVYGTHQGTSFSAPFVAGVVANILGQNPDYEFDDILDRLYEYAEYDIRNAVTEETGLPRIQISCAEYSNTMEPTVSPTTSAPTSTTFNPTRSPSKAPTAYCPYDISDDCVPGTGISYKHTCSDNGYVIVERWLFGNEECSGTYDTSTTIFDAGCCPTPAPTGAPTAPTGVPTPKPTKNTAPPTPSPSPAPTGQTSNPTTAKPTNVPSNAPTAYCAYDISEYCVRGSSTSYKQYCGDNGYIIVERWLSNTYCYGDYDLQQSNTFDLDCCPTSSPTPAPIDMF